MILRVFYWLVFLMPLLAVQNIHAQVRDSTALGIINGVVRDSVYNYVLTSATVSVYRHQDTSLLAYSLTDTYGRFNIAKLPIGVKLKVVASFMGYHPGQRDILIPQNVKTLSLRVFNLDRSNTELKEVTISAAPPVRMNGDTLEFNADAFNLDKNAVAEDLMRRLPGITLWGDGSITVNGKQVNGVKVNGKPFFGGSAVIATQNLPKNVVDKIQVYRVNRDPLNPLDSIAEINIKLKKGKTDGLFGKILGGYGTNKTHDIEGNFNLFTPRTQASLVGAKNNVNKIASDAETLIRNSTYKGAGTNIDYQPNLIKPGITVSNLLGYKFMHDFIPDPSNYKNNRVETDYFYSDNIENLNSESIVETRISPDSNVLRGLDNIYTLGNRKHQLNGSYNRHNGKHNFTADLRIVVNNLLNENRRTERFGSLGNYLESSRNSVESYDGNLQSLTGNISYRHDKDIYSENSLPENYYIIYKINHNRSSGVRTNFSEFMSAGDPTQSFKLDRIYNNTLNSTSHNFFGSIGDLSRWKLNVIGLLRNVSVNFENRLAIHNSSVEREVMEKRDQSINYNKNEYLTAINSTTVIDETPGLSFNRRFSKSLASRFAKELSINVKLQQQLYHQLSSSVREALKFRNTSNKFIPNAGVYYTNHQYGVFEQKYSLSFSKSADYPDMNDLLVLTDSLNVYQISVGNRNLQPSDKYEFSLNSHRYMYKQKNTFNFQATVKVGKVNNMMVYSSNIDSLGRAITFKRNADGYRYFNLSGTVNKAFKLNANNQIQVRAFIYSNFAASPTFINDNLIETTLFINTDSLNLYYNYKDMLAFNIKQAYSVYSSVQSFANTSFKSTTYATTLSGSLNFLRKFSLGTNVTYNNYNAHSYSDVFTIWNANLSARFLDAKNLELKFSALDLLRQNQNVINYGNENMLVYGRTNILQQYFMMTISFYPRKFGSLKKNNDN